MSGEVELWRLDVSKNLGTILEGLKGIDIRLTTLEEGQKEIKSVADIDRTEDKEAQQKGAIRSWVAISLGIGSLFAIAFFHFGIDAAGFISVVGGVSGAIAKLRGVI